jgi:hypothetical protein
VELGIAEKKAEIKSLVQERLFQLLKKDSIANTFAPKTPELSSKQCK